MPYVINCGCRRTRTIIKGENEDTKSKTCDAAKSEKPSVRVRPFEFVVRNEIDVK